MKILVVCQNYWPEPFNVHEICRGLAERGHGVSVLTGLPNYPDGVVPAEYRYGRNRRQRVGGVDIARVPVIPRGRNLKGINKVKRALNYVSFAASGSLASNGFSGYDVVLAIQLSPITMVEPAARIARENRIPLVIYAIDLWPEDLLTGGVSRQGVVFQLTERYSAATYGKADTIAVTSPDFETYIRGLGVTNARFEYLPQYAETLFEDMGEDVREKGDEFRLVFAGNIGGNQALESAVTAMTTLPSASKARLHVYGAGSRLEACKEIAGATASDKVVFHGKMPLEAMPRVYHAADAMLLTLANPENGSLVPRYTIPRKLQSYMAAGKPIIAAADGIAGRLVQEASCGVACRGGDPIELAGAVLAMEGLSPKALIELGRNARRFYSGNFTRQAFFNHLEQILERTAA